jgi:F0F1-type ATP synthase membrane subunit c/vacuolar-type H+-ATPase subunit K
MEILKTVFQATLLSLFAGGGLGFIVGFALYHLARLEAKGMNPWQAESYLCSAGNAAFTSALLVGIAGVATGFMIGVTIAIARKADKVQSSQFTLEK